MTLVIETKRPAEGASAAIMATLKGVADIVIGARDVPQPERKETGRIESQTATALSPDRALGLTGEKLASFRDRFKAPVIG